MDINIENNSLKLEFGTSSMDVKTSVQTIYEKDHKNLENLDYESSGHTGFQPAGDYALKKYVNNNFANALKGSESDATISITDASPIEHEMKINLTSNGGKIPLFDFTEITFEGSTNVPVPTNIGDLLKPGRTYTLSLDYRFTSSDSFTLGDSYEYVNAAMLGFRTEYLYEYNNDEWMEAYAYEEIYDEADELLSGNVTEFRHREIQFTVPNEPYVNNDSAIVFMGIYGIELGDDNYGSPICELKNIMVYEGTEYTEKITDFSNVNVIRKGKNLFDKNNANILKAYISGKKLVSASSTRTIYIPCKANTTYTVSKCKTARFGVGYSTTAREPYTGQTIAFVSLNNSGTKITVTTNQNAKWLVVWFYHKSYDSADLTPEAIMETIQIEENSIATKYENYVEPVLFPANADGTVKSVTPIYPTTVLTSDTKSITINCEYNKDLNKAFEELYQVIISMGGYI